MEERREGRTEEYGWLHAVDEKLWKDVSDAKAVRGMYEWLDHYVVLAKMKL